MSSGEALLQISRLPQQMEAWWAYLCMTTRHQCRLILSARPPSSQAIAHHVLVGLAKLQMNSPFLSPSCPHGRNDSLRFRYAAGPSPAPRLLLSRHAGCCHGMGSANLFVHCSMTRCKRERHGSVLKIPSITVVLICPAGKETNRDQSHGSSAIAYLICCYCMMINISYRFSLHNCSQQSLIRRRGRAPTHLDQGCCRPAFGDISRILSPVKDSQRHLSLFICPFCG